MKALLLLVCCLATSMAFNHCPETACTMQCEYGFQVGSDGCAVCSCKNAEDMTACQKAAHIDPHVFISVPIQKLTCLDNGEVAPKQCRYPDFGLQQCACADKDGNLFTQWVSGADAYNLNCDCERDRRDAMNAHSTWVHLAACDSQGLYESVQCTGALKGRSCWCVNPQTGEALTQPVFGRPTSCPQ